MKITAICTIMYISIMLYIIGNLQSCAELGLFSYIAAICLPIIICGWIYYCYKKLNEKLEKLETQLKGEDKTGEEPSPDNETLKN